MKRDAAQTIFRTVVIAGAMLGGGCGGKKPQQQTPADRTVTEPAAGSAAKDPCVGKDPCAGADPCAGRPRPNPDPCGGATGRGFILS